MNVTRDVVTDLLPVYFSGEASEDTRQLVEEYFREDPDFERVARRAATPLDALRAAHAVAPDAEKEKCGMRRIGWELRSRRVWLAGALFYTLWPLLYVVSAELAAWLGAPHTWGSRIVNWSLATFFWVLYMVKPSRRNMFLLTAIVLSAGELALILNRFDVITSRAARGTGLEIVAFGLLAAFSWFLHLRSRILDRHAL